MNKKLYFMFKVLHKLLKKKKTLITLYPGLTFWWATFPNISVHCTLICNLLSQSILHVVETYKEGNIVQWVKIHTVVLDLDSVLILDVTLNEWLNIPRPHLSCQDNQSTRPQDAVGIKGGMMSSPLGRLSVQQTLLWVCVHASRDSS